MSTSALAGSIGSRRKSRFVPKWLLSLPRRQRIQRQFQCDTGICWGRRNRPEQEFCLAQLDGPDLALLIRHDEVELRPLPLLRPIARHHIKLPVFALEDAAFARRRGLLVLASKGILAQLVSPNQRRIVSRSSVTSRRYASLHVLLQNLLPHQRCVTMPKRPPQRSQT
jgi:hypothetical protein